jgi:protein phosphatase
MCIEIISRTDTGRVRTHNEDSISGEESIGLVVLADGMGGCQAGEVASKIAVNTIMDKLCTPLKTISRYATQRYHTILLEQAVLKANQAIHYKAKQESNYEGMGTTVVAVLFHDDFISVAHVGDSRLYRLRGNEFCQLTKDHSLLQELIDCDFYTPEQAQNSPNKHILTQVLGIEQMVNIEMQQYKILEQDIYLLCSDGLSDMLKESDIYNIIINKNNSLEQAAHSLINAANEKGGKDNISLMLVRPLTLSPKVSWLQGFISSIQALLPKQLILLN